MLKVDIINRSGFLPPRYATPAAAGMDLRAFLPDAVLTLAPRERKLIATQIYLALPKGYEAQIRPRSGLAYHHGITVLNSPGTIDADYRGEIKVLLINLGENPFSIAHGDRIAQLLIASHEIVKWQLQERLGSTERGSGGHGSTGMH